MTLEIAIGFSAIFGTVIVAIIVAFVWGVDILITQFIFSEPSASMRETRS